MTPQMLELAGGALCLLASMVGTWFFLSSLDRPRNEHSVRPRARRPAIAHH